MNLCLNSNCGILTENPKYCCRSCAATVTGSQYPKRKLTNTCTSCPTLVSSRRLRCDSCWAFHYETTRKNKTLGEYRHDKSLKGKHRSWVHAEIRGFARRWNKQLVNEPCRHCGYDKHVEIAHIKAISAFSDDALLGEVNSRENLLPLCPNCHWEFDNLPRNGEAPGS